VTVRERARVNVSRGGLRSIEVLDWDTKFFGTRIARVVREPRSLRSFTKILQEARSAGIECVYLELGVESLGEAALATAHGLQLVDVRILLDRDLKAVNPTTAAAPGIDIGPPHDAELSRLGPIAERCSRVSRYYADPRFRRHAARLYRRWIVEACHGWADAVLVARRHGEPVGFITCKRDAVSPECGRIDLVCVDPQHAGQGVGALMVGASVEWFGRQALRRVRVVTQGRNIAALRLYERMAFRVERVSLFYHGWLPPHHRPR
jgi:GNAT superfamily N-acetyltransferase